MTIYDLLIIAWFAVVLAVFFYHVVREHRLGWRTSLVVLVTSLCVLMLWWPGRYGPSDRLKPGLDLAGGTTLVYHVKVPPDVPDPKKAIDDLIQVLRDRVDPTGTRNLIWRQTAGHRIEIQMALATAKTAELQHAYQDAKTELLSHNITEQQLGPILTAPPAERKQRFDELAGGNAKLRGLFRQLVQAHTKLVAATKPYRAIEKRYHELSQSLKGAGAATTQSSRSIQKQIDELQSKRQALARAYITAQDRFNELQKQVLAGNITDAQITHALNLSDNPEAGQKLSPRQKAIDALVQAHPDRKAAIGNVLSSYKAYEKVKGPLDDPSDLETLLRGSGVLEFRIAATMSDQGTLAAQYREQLKQHGPRAGLGKPWRWFEIKQIDKFASTPEAMKALEEDAAAYFASYARTAEGGGGLIGAEANGKYYLLLANTPDKAMLRTQQWTLTGARPSTDRQGKPAVGFSLDPRGGDLMGTMTAANIHKPMAILLDNQIITAPTLQSKISDSGEITGNFSQKQVNYLLRTLSAGSSAAELSDRPISISTTGPQLGQNNLSSGLRAAIWSLIIVGAFMLIYYFFAGAVANFALVLNMIIILGVMSLLHATFTLPGIAGMVLTIGMAVDANVLIYERMREELERKADLPTALRLGYEKALASIVDSNLTTLITCVVLGYTATADVKGFAVTLGIGLVASLFTALFVTRVVFDLFIRYGKVRTMSMLPIKLPRVAKLFQPNIDWVGKRFFFIGISLFLTLGGLCMVYARGWDMLAIEFRSGTQVAFHLADNPNGTPKTLPLSEVNDRLGDYAQVAAMMQKPGFSPTSLTGENRKIYNELEPIVDAAQHRVADAKAGGLPAPNEDISLLARAQPVTIGLTERTDQGTVAHGFSVSTLITDPSTLSAVIKSAFADVLETTRPVSFAQDSVEHVAGAPVYPIRDKNLGQVINRPGVDQDVTPYLGGAAVVVRDMQPAITLEDVHQRVQRMANQPAYLNLGARPFEVYGLQLASGTGPNGQALYNSVVIVAHDAVTNYIDNPNAFNQPEGLAATEWKLVKDALHRDTSLDSVSNFSSQVSATMEKQAIVAILLSLVAMVIYLWVRFGSPKWGIAATVALAHDTCVTLGAIAVSAWIASSFIGHWLMVAPFRIDLAMVAALLTLIGYSVNDTIIVFDRIRENRGRLGHVTAPIINDAINQTVSRTIITSTTAFLATLVLYVVGGPGIHGFAYAMLVGVVIGTYSSIAVASPLLLLRGHHHHHEEPASDASGQPNSTQGIEGVKG